MVELSQGDHRAGGVEAILTALVLGSAGTLWPDATEALRMFDPDLIIACNHAARDWPGRIDHWVTMHPEQFPGWIAERARQGHHPARFYWHARHRIVPAGVESRAVESWGGSSGMLCVAVAFELGVDKVVLAGVPMLKTAKHFDRPRNWDEARAYHRVWEQREPEMRGRVKSMSGWTGDLLGLPSGEWLGEQH